MTVPHPTNYPEKAQLTAAQVAKGKRLIANPDFDGIAPRPLFDQDGSCFPLLASRAKGCRLYDTTGKPYIDWVNRQGAILLGYHHPAVNEAIKDQMVAYPSLSLMHPVQIEVAELIVEMVPAAEQVWFGKNGSDACTAAVRLARAVTGRPDILQCGSHGFHDWTLGGNSHLQGVPRSEGKHVHAFEFNNAGAVEGLLNEHKDQVAAIILEPMTEQLPDTGFLERLRELADHFGVLLVFNELVSGFRVARGGAQEMYGVTPDLTCLGRGMANGMPLSVLAGKHQYMQKIHACGLSLCGQLETLSLSVAKTVLQKVKTEHVVEHINNTGQVLREGVDELAEKTGVPCSLVGHNSRLMIRFAEAESVPVELLHTTFVQECMRRGVLTNGNFLASHSHDDQAVAETLLGLEHAIQSVGQLTDARGRTTGATTGGELEPPPPESTTGEGAQSTAQTDPAAAPIPTETPDPADSTGPGLEPDTNKPPVPQVIGHAVMAEGYIDRIVDGEGMMLVGGWILLDQGAADSIELVSADGDQVKCKSVHRPDLVPAFPEKENALNAGFEASLAGKKFSRDDQYEFTLIAKSDGEIAFRCWVRIPEQRSVEPPHSLRDGVLFL